MGVSINGYRNSWMVNCMDHPKMKWMMWVQPHDLGNLHLMIDCSRWVLLLLFVDEYCWLMMISVQYCRCLVNGCLWCCYWFLLWCAHVSVTHFKIQVMDGHGVLQATGDDPYQPIMDKIQHISLVVSTYDVLFPCMEYPLILEYIGQSS